MEAHLLSSISTRKYTTQSNPIDGDTDPEKLHANIYDGQFSGFLAAGAWILTPGTHTGVFQTIGSAVRSFLDTDTSLDMDEIVLLGMPSWVSTAQRQCLKIGRAHV